MNVSTCRSAFSMSPKIANLLLVRSDLLHAGMQFLVDAAKEGRYAPPSIAFFR